MKRYYKIYYVPGMISLTLLPILFMCRTNQYLKNKTQYCISILRGDDDYKCINSREITFLKRNNITLYLMGDSKMDRSNLILIEHFSKGIQLSRNEFLGLKVVLGQKTKYKTYIGLMNACLKSGVSDWIPLGDSVFIFHRENKTGFVDHSIQNTHSYAMYRFECDHRLVDKYPPTLLEKIKKHKNEIHLAIPIFSVILLLFFLSVRRLMRMVV